MNGLLLLQGGITSHGAVVMRSLDKSAVVGFTGLSIDETEELLTCTADSTISIHKGDIITIDGSSGTVYLGEMPTLACGLDENFRTIMHWADKYKRMHVFADVDSLESVLRAKDMGAEGIGLFVTERMFCKEECIHLFRHMILTDNPAERIQCLNQMLPLQQKDFFDIFCAVGNSPVKVRLLDSALHEFLPKPSSDTYKHEVEVLAERMNLTYEQCLQRVQELQENNPLLGFRGCRLSIVYPEITEMQTRAIIGNFDSTFILTILYEFFHIVLILLIFIYF